MKVLSALLVVLIACGTLLLASAEVPPGPDAVLLTSVESLVFQEGRLTTGRRSAPVAQMLCVGDCSVRPRSILCRNVGHDGNDVNWKCETEDLPVGYELVAPEVSCEGYRYAADRYVLQGSCGITYQVADNARAYGQYVPPQGHSHHAEPSGGSFATFVTLLCIALVLLCCCGCCRSSPRHHHQHNPPPVNPMPEGQPGAMPYYQPQPSVPSAPPRSPSSSPRHSSAASGSASASSSSSWANYAPNAPSGPGFWSGMVAGAGLHRMFAGSSQASQNQQPAYQPPYQPSHTPSYTSSSQPRPSSSETHKSSAQELDRAEAQLIEEGNDPQATKEHHDQGSQNVDASGNFSIEVLRTALQNFGLSCVSLTAEEIRAAQQDPLRESGFLCNLGSHWFAIRKLGSSFYSLNSTDDLPKPIGEFYLSAFIQQLQLDGYSIFAVRGEYPPPMTQQSGNGVWIDSAELGNKSSSAPHKTQTPELSEEDALQRAIDLSMQPESDHESSSADLEKAIKLSMMSPEASPATSVHESKSAGTSAFHGDASSSSSSQGHGALRGGLSGGTMAQPAGMRVGLGHGAQMGAASGLSHSSPIELDDDDELQQALVLSLQEHQHQQHR